jgi:hypothetical protein
MLDDIKHKEIQSQQIAKEIEANIEYKKVLKLQNKTFKINGT